MATTTPPPTALPGNFPGDARDEVAALLGVQRAPGPRSALRWVILVAVIAIAIAGGVSIVKGRAGGPGPRFRTAEVARGDLRVTVTATGTLQATTTVEVGAEVSGRILKMTVDANDPVKKGQVLAVIDPEQLRAAVDQAGAQLAASDAAIRQARATRQEAKAAADRAAIARSITWSSRSPRSCASGGTSRPGSPTTSRSRTPRRSPGR